MGKPRTSLKVTVYNNGEKDQNDSEKLRCGESASSEVGLTIGSNGAREAYSLRFLPVLRPRPFTRGVGRLHLRESLLVYVRERENA
jgi:hypothetical protein